MMPRNSVAPKRSATPVQQRATVATPSSSLTPNKPSKRFSVQITKQDNRSLTKPQHQIPKGYLEDISEEDESSFSGVSRTFQDTDRDRTKQKSQQLSNVPAQQTEGVKTNRCKNRTHHCPKCHKAPTARCLTQVHVIECAKHGTRYPPNKTCKECALEEQMELKRAREAERADKEAAAALEAKANDWTKQRQGRIGKPRHKDRGPDLGKDMESSSA